jgi:two-component system, sensor histidine kinase YesM
MKNINDTMNIILTDSETQKFLKMKSTDAYNNINNELLAYNKMENFLTSFERSGNIYKLQLYVAPGPFYVGKSDRFYDLAEFTKSGIYSRITKSASSNTWISDHALLTTANKSESTFAVFKKIYDLGDPRDLIGICRIDVLENDLAAIIDQTLATPNSYAMILDASQQAIVKVGRPVSIDMSILLQQLTDAENNQSADLVLGTSFINRQHFKIFYQNIPYSDWQLVLLIPSNDIFSVTNQARNENLIIIVVLAMLSYLFILFISTSMTKRIHNLIMGMKRAEGGNLTELNILNNGDKSSSDEIGELNRSFNRLLSQLSLSINEKLKIAKEAKNSELKALQAQINPHFLYNTLDLIRWMAREGKTSEITSLVLSLAKFYRLSLSSGEELITLRNELEHIKTYIEIQNKRFNNSIQFESYIPEELLDLKIIKLLMQPLVENSILHGIQEKADERGKIIIDGEWNEHVLSIYISDNGVGMSPGKMMEIMQHTNPKGYGVKNIQQRLQLVYGPEYGLSYTSEPGSGTTVRIKIPARQAEDGRLEQ